MWPHLELAGLPLDRTRSTAGTGGSQYLDSSRTFVSTDPSRTIGTGTGSSIITMKRPVAASTRAFTQAITSGTTGAVETTVTLTSADYIVVA